ncbi:uncharacterized protein LOC110248786 [Exaiptasia diaphana]|uniref:MARVEL domain-containing protein n=1 Tax=Exaiptasia diaphana TaxID=2652724 RepID=A0A913XVL9_EXADI|nr:uncharacterized protein LOC110248782 [Exaiptasia diaphana]XP_020910999.1 uncharacterized protein LOC110248786 [Exaiptasia diaphana]
MHTLRRARSLKDVPPYKPYGPKTFLKILIIIITCLGFSTQVVSHIAFGDDYTFDYQSRYYLFFGSHLFGMVESIIVLAIFLTGMDNVCGSRRCWEILNLTVSFLLSILCGVSAGLMIFYCNMLYRNQLYKTSPDYWKWYTDHMIISITCGFLNSVLFLLDAALHADAFR